MLVIDDNPLVRAGVSALLSGEPTLRVVDEAETGREGLERARDRRPDLIVLDQGMPGLTGLQTLRELRLALPQTRVVMFTLNPEIEAEALALGATAVVAKEEPALLLATLQRLARRSPAELPPTQPRPIERHR